LLISADACHRDWPFQGCKPAATPLKPRHDLYRGEVAEWSNAAVSKTVVGLRRPRVRIPVSPPIRNKAGHLTRRVCCAHERSQQIALRSHDADFAFIDVDPLGQGSQVVTAVAAAGQAHPVAGGAGEGAEHLWRYGFLADRFEQGRAAVSIDTGLVAGGFQGGDAGFQLRVV
jgi:hypothetical protein